MATAVLRPAPQIVAHRVDPAPRGLMSWLTTTDHKRIGILYLGTEALMIRLQLGEANNTLVTPEVYNQLFTMHGTTMVFLFIVPVLAGFGNYFVPLMIGARDMAFPRLNALSYWLFLAGGLVLPGGVWGGVGAGALILHRFGVPSKVIAEREVERMAADGLAVVIVSPSTPIGPRDVKPTPTGRIIVEAAEGRMPAFLDTGLNLVHVDDVAAGHLAALRGLFGQVLQGKLTIVGGEGRTKAGWFDLFDIHGYSKRHNIQAAPCCARREEAFLGNCELFTFWQLTGPSYVPAGRRID